MNITQTDYYRKQLSHKMIMNEIIIIKNDEYRK